MCPVLQAHDPLDQELQEWEQHFANTSAHHRDTYYRPFGHLREEVVHNEPMKRWLKHARSLLKRGIHRKDEAPPENSLEVDTSDEEEDDEEEEECIKAPPQKRKQEGYQHAIRMDRWHLEITGHVQKQRRLLAGKSREEAFLEDPRLSSACKGKDLYERALLAVKLIEATLSFRLSQTQHRFIRTMIEVCIPHIYREDFLRFKPDLLKQFRQKEFRKGAFLSCPRQFGKSTMTAIAAAALMYVGRRLNIVVVANSQDIAAKMMKAIIGYYICLPNAHVLIQNQRSACTICADERDSYGNRSDREIKLLGYYNMIRACPGNADTQRGINANVFIVDEADFINKDMITQVIGPLLAVGNTVLIALSTFNGSKGWFSKIFQRNDDLLNRLIHKVQVEFRCAKCTREGVRDCEHLRTLRPAQLSGDNDMAKLLITDEKLLEQELLGLITDNRYSSIFREEFLSNLKVRDRVNLGVHKPGYLFTWIDPKGTSVDQSYFAIMTLYISERNHVVIVGFDEHSSCIVHDLDPFVKNYYTNLKNNVDLQKHNHVLFVENNFSGIDASYWANLVQTIIPDVYVASMREKVAGVRTGLNKNEAIQESLMDFATNKVWFSEKVVFSAPSKEKELMDQLFLQLEQVRIHNGKITGKAKNVRDDLAISLFMCAWFGRRHIHQQEIQALTAEYESRLTNPQYFAPSATANFFQMAPFNDIPTSLLGV
jgi:hypothetical protein